MKLTGIKKEYVKDTLFMKLPLYFSGIALSLLSTVVGQDNSVEFAGGTANRNSLAFGANSYATNSSFAFGNAETYYASHAFAFGEGTYADVLFSFAFGDSAYTVSPYSFAFGRATETYADYSFAFGNYALLQLS